MILPDFGTNLPLDQRRKDALASYARKAAGDAKSKQLWVEKTWDLKDYEAKDLLKGKASEAVWARIICHKNGGWRVVIPVLGSVIGQSLDDFIASEIEAVAHAKQRLEESEALMRRRYEAVRSRSAVGSGRLRLVDPQDRAGV